MIHIILGTKAQLIKMAPIMVELKNRKLSYNLILTGQHQETMDKLLNNFGLPAPDMNLYVGKDMTGVGQMVLWSGKILYKTIRNKKEIFKHDTSGIVLVHGDTTSALVGALAAKFAGLHVGHVESGLRSFNLFHPFPEEITRILTFNLANYYFCPDEWALQNVKSYRGVKLNTRENTLRDALTLAVKSKKTIKIAIPKKKYCVANIHRFENVFNRPQLEKMVEIFEKIAERMHVVFILHSPTEKNLRKYDLYNRLTQNKNIECRPRYDYFEFMKLVANAEYMVSDGGSNQEECYYMGKPCLLLRNFTERREGLGENTVLSQYDMGKIMEFIQNYKKYRKKTQKPKATSSKMIVDVIQRFA